jgi:mannose-6-phosphate isomerase-like protein (cupin superfamily)
MGTEDGGIFVGPADGKDLTNPIGGGWSSRSATRIPPVPTRSTTTPSRPALPDPAPISTHRHEEAFYVLEGELTVRVGQRKIVAPVGSFVVVPRGMVHQPSNPGPLPTRVLLVFSPSGMDRFFEEAAEGRMPLAAVPSDPVVLKRLEAFTEKYGYEFAELPAET